MKTPRQNDRLITTRRNTRSKTSTKGRENSEPIPIDLVIEVLSRLPPKSIARFRSVSKPWASILLRQDFTELFLTRSLSSPKLLFACKKKGVLLFYSSPQPQNPDENSSLVAANNHMNFPLIYDSSEVCCHVYGLICLKHLRILKGRTDTVLEICNPSTGQSLTLPKVKTRRVGVTSFLGYDPIDKQFKLLSMTKPTYGRNRISGEHQVLTLGTGKLSWRMTECSIPHYPLCDGICISGVLYYNAFVQSGWDYGIASFDIRSEKFKFIEEDDKYMNSQMLVKYMGKLAILKSSIMYGTSSSFELSVLEDVEKNEWSHQTYVLPPLWKDIVGDAMLSFVGVTRTGELVLSPCYAYPYNVSYLVYYNIERNTVTIFEIQGTDAFKRCGAHIFLDYVENVKLWGSV